MWPRPLPLLICGFLILLLVSAFIGCSSSEELFGPEIAFADGGGGNNFKLTITTDYTGTCPETNIVFTLPKADHLYFEITNATGYHVRTLVDDDFEAGSYIVSWDGANDDGEGVDAGIYLFHLVTSDIEVWQASAVGIDIEDPGEE